MIPGGNTCKKYRIGQKYGDVVNTYLSPLPVSLFLSLSLLYEGRIRGTGEIRG